MIWLIWKVWSTHDNKVCTGSKISHVGVTNVEHNDNWSVLWNITSTNDNTLTAINKETQLTLQRTLCSMQMNAHYITLPCFLAVFYILPLWLSHSLHFFFHTLCLKLYVTLLQWWETAMNSHSYQTLESYENSTDASSKIHLSVLDQHISYSSRLRICCK